MAKKSIGQLELFDLENASAPVPRKHRLRRVQLNLRYDQIILIGIGGLIGLTVVFASGVERGKQMVRSERSILPRAEQIVIEPLPAEPEPVVTAEVQPETPVIASEPPAIDGYAVQVVTYSKKSSAERELERLVSGGERAFIESIGEHIVLFVGPFESRTRAQEKSIALKKKYNDCFIKKL